MGYAADAVDALIFILCAIGLWQLGLAYRATRAPGLGFLMLLCVWSIGVRVIILLELAPLRGYSAELVLPSFIFLAIGAYKLSHAVRVYYIRGDNDDWMQRIASYFAGRKQKGE